MSMNFNWNFAQPTNGQAAFDAAQAALQNKRNNVYTQNMGDRQVGNANDMMSWMQQGNDAATYQQQQEAATEQQAQQQAQQAQQQEAEKQMRIKEIEAEIAEIEQRIAHRKRAMNRNEALINSNIAALEARKINAQDPTSIWRWKAGMDAQKAQRAEDLARVEAEKKLSEEKNLKINRNKIDNILQSTMPTKNMTRDKMDMAVKQLNDAEELAKNYGDTEALKKINERKNELGIYVPVDDEANIIESDFVKNMEMVGKKGGMNKKQFAQYVQSVLDDPKNKHIWQYSPELQRRLYTAIGKNTGAKPTNYAGY